jgi:tRNA (guanine37-N1)-methyltransferase
MEHPPSSENAPSSKSSSRPLLEICFLTLFPNVFEPALGSSLIGKARSKGLVHFKTVQIRDFSKDKHKTVDDTPYGGGEGMLLRADVLYDAWKSVHTSNSLTNLLSPQGEPFTQDMAKELAGVPTSVTPTSESAGNVSTPTSECAGPRQLILVCGHYEGVDERFIELCVDREVSIGDYVLTGGELPALVMADTITRLLPGVVGNDRSLSQDSLENNLLKYPQYTRPREFEGLSVPEVLLGGDHKQIAAWRAEQSRERTARKRPDLLANSGANSLANPIRNPSPNSIRRKSGKSPK